MAGFFDDAAHGSVFAEDKGEVSSYGLRVIFFFDGNDGGRGFFLELVHQGVEIGEFEKNVAEEKEKRAFDAGFELSEGVRDSELFLLLNILDLESELASVAEGLFNSVPKVSDDDEHFFDSDLAHVLELISEEGFVGDGDNGLGEKLAEGPHPGPLARREDNALVGCCVVHVFSRLGSVKL